MSKRAKEKAELIANGIMISVQGKTGRVVYNTKEKSFTHYELMCAAQQGYEQAEKDLALTWQDVAVLITIYEQEVEAGNISRYDDEGAPTLQEASEIILRKFNEIRKK